MIIDAKIAGPCNHNGCKNPAEFNVCFALRVNAKHPPAISTPIVQVCAEHNGVVWADIYSEAGWKQICDGMIASGYAKPVIKHSYLVIEPII